MSETLTWVFAGLVIFGIWLAAGVWSAGYYFAFFQDNWPSLAAADYQSDRRRALWGILFGPIGLFVEWAVGHMKYGWRWPR